MDTKVMKISPCMAKKWLENAAVGNRRVDMRTVSRYANDMQSGHWELTHQGIAFDADGHLIDGQHRLRAIIQSGMDVEMQVSFTRLNLHSNIDSNHIRSLSFMSGIGTQVLAAIRTVWWLESGGGVATSGMRMSAGVANVQLQLIGEARMASLQSYMGGSDNRVSGNVLGAVIYAMSLSESSCIKFLGQVKTGEMLVKGDPAYAFRSWYARKQMRRSYDTAMAALVAVSAELSGRRISFVRETDDGYRTITAKRKRLGIPRTPEIDKR